MIIVGRGRKTSVERIIFTINDWKGELGGGDEVSTATVTSVPDGLSVDRIDTTADVVTAWVSGGTPGGAYTLVFEVTSKSSPPQIEQRGIVVKVD